MVKSTEITVAARIWAKACIFSLRECLQAPTRRFYGIWHVAAVSQTVRLMKILYDGYKHSSILPRCDCVHFEANAEILLHILWMEFSILLQKLVRLTEIVFNKSLSFWKTKRKIKIDYIYKVAREIRNVKIWFSSFVCSVQIKNWWGNTFYIQNICLSFKNIYRAKDKQKNIAFKVP